MSIGVSQPVRTAFQSLQTSLTPDQLRIIALEDGNGKDLTVADFTQAIGDQRLNLKDEQKTDIQTLLRPENVDTMGAILKVMTDYANTMQLPTNNTGMDSGSSDPYSMQGQTMSQAFTEVVNHHLSVTA